MWKRPGVEQRIRNRNSNNSAYKEPRRNCTRKSASDREKGTNAVWINPKLKEDVLEQRGQRPSSSENKVWIKPKQPAVLNPEAANTTSGKSIARDPSAVVSVTSRVSVNPSRRESLRLKRTATTGPRAVITASRHGRTRKGHHAVWTKTKHSAVPEPLHSSTKVKKQEDQVETRSTNTVLVKPAAKESCLFFNKAGKCRNGDKCPFFHDPRLVNVCNGFLRGVCVDKECPLRHEADPGKVPLCSFFLRGVCTQVSSEAAICQDFAAGYCPRGESCRMKHLLPKDAAGRKAKRAKKSISMSMDQRRQQHGKLDGKYLHSLEGLLEAEQLTGGDDLLPRWALDHVDH